MRPQPLGVLPWPAGLLVLPDGHDGLAATLLSGERPQEWPATAAFVARALDGDAEGAAALIAGNDDLARYNRAVLVGGDGAWESLADVADPDLAALVALGCYTVGLRDDAPSADGVDGEIEAMVRSGRASAALEAGDPAGAHAELTAAIAAAAVSPALAASLSLTDAELLRESGDPAAAESVLNSVLNAMTRTADRETLAELHLARGMARQELGAHNKGYLVPAVNDYTEAAKTFREETHPEQFATVNVNLALAYLIMPMSSEGDRIRVGVAVNSLRAALRIYTPETHPHEWASTQLNLANALQYLPSVHQEDNLDEAVHLYEQVLAYRDPNVDPLGYARILANQGNALGHLGVFSDADERLQRARALFAAQGDVDAVASVDEVLASLAAAREAAH